jgi:biopolymer transport protein ExbB/TolQ
MAATITVVCPNPQCKHAMRASAEHIGRKGRCPACKSLVEIVPAGAGRQRVLPAGGPEASEPKAVSGMQVNTLLAGLYGAAATLALYLLIFCPLGGRPEGTWGRDNIGDLMTHRGPIQHCITLVTCWGLAILLLRYRAVMHELRAAELELTLIPLEIGLQITSDNVDQFLDHLGKLPVGQQRSILARRILGALEHFKHRHNVSEVQTYLASQAELEASSVDSGYTLLRVFIWVCPILGFIGTVTGISEGVTGLQRSLANMEATAEAAPGAPAPDLKSTMMGGMKTVTGGLAVAFDTTLLGLICVVFLMFPCEALRKIEYGMLDRIEEFANESLLRRMAEEGAAPTAEELPQIVRQSLEAAFKEHQRWLAQWQAQVGQLGQAIGSEFETHFATVQERLAQADASRLDNINRAGKAVDEMFQHVSQASRSLQQLAGADFQSSFQTLQQVQQALRDNATMMSQMVNQQRQAIESSGPDLLLVLQGLQRALENLAAHGNGSAQLAPISPTPEPPVGFLGRMLGRGGR